MTATNHVLTGSVIAAAIQKPVIALPLALLSHIICDALPHFGKNPKFKHESRNFAIHLILDCSIAASILLFIILFQPLSWLLLVSCGVIAALPDLLWIPNYIRVLRGKSRQYNRLSRFLSDVQNESPVLGAGFEVIWFCIMSWILLTYILRPV